MIGKISAPRGERVEPLIYYLFGPGRHEEHTDPHIVAGWRHPAELEPPLRPDGSRDFRRLNGLLRQPHEAMGNFSFARPVWHCAVRAAPEDKTLSDEEWAQIAHDVMHRTGLAPHGQEDDAVRWIAVRHGDDHIHIVAMLARQDGRRPSTSNDRYRVREACLAAERRYGLRSTAPADRTAPRRPTRAETEKTARRRLDEPTRVTLRRHVTTAAATSASSTEFFTRLQAARVLTRPRYSSQDPGQVTGYAVALPGDTSRDGSPVWYGGAKLAPDLSWPKLSQRWPGTGQAPARRLTAAERAAAWDQAVRDAADATGQIRALAGTDPAAAADAAWAASDALHAAAALLGSRVLRQAADAYDRAARAPYGRIPAPTPAGNQLRQAARLLGALAYLTRDPALTPIVLITRLAALAEAVAHLRDVQQRAAQAAAARASAGHLHAVTRLTPARPTVPRPQTTARLAGLSFPPPGPIHQPADGQARPGRPIPRPPRRPSPPRRRGPAP
jgi:hypothetical protein